MAGVGEARPHSAGSGSGSVSAELHVNATRARVSARGGAMWPRPRLRPRSRLRLRPLRAGVGAGPNEGPLRAPYGRLGRERGRGRTKGEGANFSAAEERVGRIPTAAPRRGSRGPALVRPPSHPLTHAPLSWSGSVPTSRASGFCQCPALRNGCIAGASSLAPSPRPADRPTVAGSDSLPSPRWPGN